MLRNHSEVGQDSIVLVVSAVGEETLEVRRLRHGQLEFVFATRVFGSVWDLQVLSKINISVEIVGQIIGRLDICCFRQSFGD